MKRALLLAAGLAGLQAAPQSLAQTPNSGPEAPATGDALGDKLNKTDGVIRPKRTLDPDMPRAPPPVKTPTPVIPPPGAPGGDPRIQPK